MSAFGRSMERGPMGSPSQFCTALKLLNVVLARTGLQQQQQQQQQHLTHMTAIRPFVVTARFSKTCRIFRMGCMYRSAPSRGSRRGVFSFTTNTRDLPPPPQRLPGHRSTKPGSSVHWPAWTILPRKRLP